jgi:hypothetical protein
MTLVQSVRRSVTIAGFPLSAWAFALRIWAAMMVALYAAFWLQLESASSAAVTVGVLALQTRGQAYHKAVYRVLATIVGVAASFVIAGLFPQTRSLFVIGFAGWLGLCVYVGGLLDGNRAYSGRPVWLYGCPGRGDADRCAAEHFLGWDQPGRGDRGRDELFHFAPKTQSLLLLKFVTVLSLLFAGTGATYRAIASGESYVGRQPGRRRCGNGVTYIDSVDRSKAVDASIDPRRVD